MEVFNQILLMLHFLGLGLGVSGSVAGMVTARLIAASPADAPVLSRFPPAVSKIGQAGLGLLWITGIIMIWSRWGGPAAVPWLFWVKLALVIALTVDVGFIARAIKEAQGGSQAARDRLQMLGPIGTALLLLVIIFAVLTFN